MNNGKQKLELTWIGKNDQPKLEPRILIEDPEKSYGNKNTENMLIYGDNLLALKALEQDFAGKIKCIYIDPPFNSDQAFPEYDDSMEHSLWLDLMYRRVKYLHNLLSADGVFFAEIDDTEGSYLQIILDEIFGRRNRIGTVSIRRSAATGHKAINPGPVNVVDFLHIYSKNKSAWKYNPIYVARKDYDWAYSTRLINPKDNYSNWKFESLSDHIAKTLGYNSMRECKKAIGKRKFDVEYVDYAMSHPEEIIRFAQPNYSGVSKAARELIDLSVNEPTKIFRLEREEHSDMYFLSGDRILFLKDKVADGTAYNSDGVVLIEPLTNFWDDLAWQGIAKEGGVDFPKNKKPERLLHRIIEMTTKNGDWILDSFAGSGTTGAVSHKMNRKWILVEKGEHCHTLAQPRLISVVNGTDKTGISKMVQWKGGGGFKYYYLAPSLLKQDKYNNWVINPEYNGNMLASAMAKHEGFRYQPDEQIYWKQGQSTEKDFIYTTTQFITVETLDRIHEEMQSGESLLICCKSFSKACEDRFSNITIKKIPKMLLGRCEFGKDDYSLNIINMPVNPNAPEFIPKGFNDKKDKIKKKKENDSPTLFSK
ncbi:MAG: Adenine specific DNA methylase MOD [Ignavibacteria bacterium]|nr:MAG: Adenine specific DNA methylase MOD [Ignavibacteria bacterium]KAF0162484.1 MAG: Adenine specific DNA methylase MOD [Ignavibacteria bacterium]